MTPDLPPPPPPVNSSQSPQPEGTPGSPSRGSEETDWAILGTGDSVELASFRSRLVARLIDSAIVAAMAVALLVFAGVASFVVICCNAELSARQSATARAILIGGYVTIVAVALLYETALVATKGQTLGKRAGNIKVVRADNGSVPGWGKSMVRGSPLVMAGLGMVASFMPMMLRLLCMVALVVLFSSAWDKGRQGWHDKAARTLVVKD